MPLLRRPSEARVAQYVDSQRELAFTYDEVGASATTPPARYAIDHTRAALGEGREMLLAAKDAIANLDQFRTGWIEVFPRDAKVETGQVLVVAARSLGIWWLNSARIAYVVDEESRFGFAYGTLPGHSAKGEERFLVEIDEVGVVWYDILAFSRPRRWHAWIGYPHLRRLQRRFGEHSVEAMRRATEAVVEGAPSPSS